MPHIVLLTATVADITRLRPLLDEALGSQGGFLQSQADEIFERLTTRINETEQAKSVGLRPTYRLVFASKAGEPVGFISMTCLDSGVVATQRTILVDAIHVQSSARKSGVGRALLASTIEFADATGAEEITIVSTQSREANRFLARNGFGPITTRRVGSVGALRRGWGLEPKLDPATGELTESERLRRRRVLLRPRADRRTTRSTLA